MLFRSNPISPFHIKKLLRRLQWSQHANQERPNICVYSRLETGHKDYSGRQFVYSKTVTNLKVHDDLRRPPDGLCLVCSSSPFLQGRKCDVEVGLDTCWYGRMVFLFGFLVKSDSSQIWEWALRNDQRSFRS